MTNYLSTLSDGNTGLFSYLKAINSIPSLSEDEEYVLARNLVEYQDISAAQKLVESHLKLVAKIALTYRNYGLPVVDLISEGNLGLMQAVKKFDPERGFRLSTYAIWWIKAAIQEFILKSWSLVRIGTTAAQKKLFFNLGKLKRKIFNTQGRDFSSEDYKMAAEELNVKVEEVAEMDSRLRLDKYLDEPIGDEDEGVSLIDIIPESRPSHETMLASNQIKHQRKEKLFAAISNLNEREQYIIKARKLSENPATLEDLSSHFSISKERVRQIEEKALEKITSFVLA